MTPPALMQRQMDLFFSCIHVRDLNSHGSFSRVSRLMSLILSFSCRSSIVNELRPNIKDVVGQRMGTKKAALKRPGLASKSYANCATSRT